MKNQMMAFLEYPSSIASFKAANTTSIQMLVDMDEEIDRQRANTQYLESDMERIYD